MAALQYKYDHNRIAYLGRERGSEDFTDILSYLDHSPLRYALTHDPPVVFDSLVKQFWATATVRPNAAGSHDLVATIDGREVVVTESLIRAQLQLDDANGIFDMQIDDIFAGMGAIGYPPGRTLTFLKHHLSPQWRFLVHTILHCLSPKAGSWNQFPSSIATALICLSTGRVYNFSRFILEGMIANVKATRHKFLMYPRFLQMLVAIETADRTPRPTFGFTRKLFSNMKLKWEGEAIPLTPPMLAIAAAGNVAADEEHVPAHAVAGSPAEAHPVPHPPPFSPVREPTPERLPETEWVVPIPVSPITDWRPWPSVPAHFPIRDPTPEPASPPPTQTFIFEEPLAFGPEPRPAGYVDPDVLEPIIFGPQPRPSDFVDSVLEEPVIFGPPPRPDNYIEPADIDNLVSMEDDTIHGGFHEGSPVGPNDAPTPTADAAGRAEDPSLLTSLSAKLDRCMGRIDSLETELGTSKKIMGGAILTLVSRVMGRIGGLIGNGGGLKENLGTQILTRFPSKESWKANVKTLEAARRIWHLKPLGHDQDTVPAEDIGNEPRRRFPIRRISLNPMVRLLVPDKGQGSHARFGDPCWSFLAEGCTGPGNRLEEVRQTRNWVDFDDASRYKSCTGCVLLGAGCQGRQLYERLTAIKGRKEKSLGRFCAIEHSRPAAAPPSLPSKRQRVERTYSQPSVVPAATTHPADDSDSAGGRSFHPAGSILLVLAVLKLAGGIHLTILEEFHAFILDSDEDEQIGLVVCVAAERDSDDENQLTTSSVLRVSVMIDIEVENRRHRNFSPEREVATLMYIVRISFFFVDGMEQNFGGHKMNEVVEWLEVIHELWLHVLDFNDWENCVYVSWTVLSASGLHAGKDVAVTGHSSPSYMSVVVVAGRSQERVWLCHCNRLVSNSKSVDGCQVTTLHWYWYSFPYSCWDEIYGLGLEQRLLVKGSQIRDGCNGLPKKTICIQSRRTNVYVAEVGTGSQLNMDLHLWWAKDTGLSRR
ncbi:hypothetical protein Tco_0150721 [Tanacetum coccineum]